MNFLEAHSLWLLNYHSLHWEKIYMLLYSFLLKVLQGVQLGIRQFEKLSPGLVIF